MEIVRLPKVSRRHVSAGAQQQSSVPQPAAPALVGRSANRTHLRLLGGAGKNQNGSTESVSNTFSAPERIIAETRANFRKDALAFMERAVEAGLVEVSLEMSKTVEIDASGLGVLVVVQKKAKELGLHMRVTRAPQQVRYLLLLTKLEHLFEFAD
jgi:ABC-type transporter Mla MlaB component